MPCRPFLVLQHVLCLKNPFGFPLILFSRKEHTLVVHHSVTILIVSHCLDITFLYIRTALGVACYYGHTNIVSFLLNNDANVNRQDNDGESVDLI